MDVLKDYFYRIYRNWKINSEFERIVSDMDDDHLFNNEKQSIRESGLSLKKYGSTCNHVRYNEVLIKHQIEKEDTLQGIALKYGCTTEQIRRANRLFASDSLFLRQFLMIPVEKSSPYYPKDDRPQSLPPQRAASLAGGYPPSLQNQQQNSKSLDTLSPEEENKKNIDEFLDKIDSTIAESKKYVIKSQKSVNILTEEEDCIFTSNGRGSEHMTPSTSHNSYYQQQPQHARQSSSSSSSDATTSQQHVVVMTQGRRVQSSLQKLERAQDEFFEL